MKSPDEVKKEFVQEWLAKAEEDFKVAILLLRDEHQFFNTAAFHTQQAVPAAGLVGAACFWIVNLFVG
jgi:hypothetical protein